MPQGREPCTRCLREGALGTGYRKVVNIIELELVLREIETFGLMRDPERYHLTIYGTPEHDASLGLALRGPSPVAQFHAGRRPPGRRHAELLRRQSGRTLPKGPRAGLRVLAAEEDEARALLGIADRRAAPRGGLRYAHLRRHRDAQADKVDPLAPVGIAAAQLDERSARSS